MKIEALTILTTDIEQQRHFYSEILGFECLSYDVTSLTMKIGESLLSFRSSSTALRYHFAFNIPARSMQPAQDWLRRRVKLLSLDGKERFIFKDWNAEAIYFYDPDGNIVEFIAREATGYGDHTSFSASQVVNISEVGIGTTDIPEIVNQLNAMEPIALFDGDLKRFCALGDDEGLFIIANPKVKTWMPTGDMIEQAEFEIRGTYNFRYKNGKIIEID